MTVISLSLISHTNVGKTTLARTLLRRDVGEIRDASHVTLQSSRHTLLETATGDALELWDTPGFGDSVRLLRRLELSSNPLGWFLSHVWDRYADRPFFSSQQALRIVRDHADVVLYLVNVSEDPAASAYVEPEMRILDWIAKPVIVVMNQLGLPDPVREGRDLEQWRARLREQPNVRDVLAFDAFARCWVHEHVLLDRVAAALPPEKRQAFDRLSTEWRMRNEAIFEKSMRAIARQLATTAVDSEPVRPLGAAETARSWVGGLFGGRDAVDPATQQAMSRLTRRLEAEERTATDELIELHGLSGHATAQMLERVRADFAVDRALDPARAGLIGGAISGALGGLAADLAAGGITLGAGALVGGLLGAAGSHGLARAYNTSRGSDRSAARWSTEFMNECLATAVLRYLVVAHYGRGRGDYVESVCPQEWKTAAERAVAGRPVNWDVASSSDPNLLAARLARELDATVRTVLRELYSSFEVKERTVMAEGSAPPIAVRAGRE